VDGQLGEIHIDRPVLPTGVDQLHIRRIVMGEAQVDLTFERMGTRVVAFAEGSNGRDVAIRARF